MNMILKDVAAVQSSQKDIIGHLTWYAMSEMLIKPDELRQKMIDSGLGEGWMPKEIRIPDAFRRATAIKQRKQISDGVYENYLCREVASDKLIVQRNIVCETVDTKGKRLNYEGEAAVLILDKKNGQISINASTSTANQIAQEANIRFQIYRENYSGAILRTTIMNILKSMSPTPVRPAGGVYFVPRTFEDRLNSLISFLRSLEKGEGEMIPLINTRDMKGMITRKLQEHLQNTLQSCDAALGDSLTKGQAKEILDDARRVVEDYKQYTSIISKDINQMEYCVTEIRTKIALMLEKMTK